MSMNQPESPVTMYPSAWQIASFEDCIEVISDQGKRVNQSEYLPSGTIPVVDQGESFVGGYTNDECKRYNGPLPVLVFGDHTRRVKYINFSFAVGAQGVKLLRPLPCWEPKFLYYMLPALPIPDRGYSRHFQFIRQLSFPVPPIQEQRRIVEEVEKQFSRLDAGVVALKRVLAALKRYRASVLQSACEGRLVLTEAKLAQAEGRDYEPADKLLTRILVERRSRWEADHLAKMQSQGKPPKDNAWKSKYQEPAPPDTSRLPELPEGWCWVTVEQICERIVDCLHSTPKFQESGSLCIDTNCIKPGRIIIEKVRYVDSATFIERNRRMTPLENDILFSREGALLGVAVRVPGNLEFCLGQRMMIFRLGEHVDAKFYENVLNSGVFRSQYIREITGTASPHLNIQDTRLFGIPLPPKSEQVRIVSEVDRRLSIIDELENIVDANLKRAERLRHAILKQAFEGKLVPQYPNDEPASVLLEKIRAERNGKAKG